MRAGRDMAGAVAAPAADAFVSVTSASSGTEVGRTPPGLRPRKYAFSPGSVLGRALDPENRAQHAQAVLQPPARGEVQRREDLGQMRLGAARDAFQRGAARRSEEH